MVQPRTGITFNTRSDDPRPAVITDMSTIYLVGTSEDATPSFFPVNSPVMFNSSDVLMLANAGTGNLKTSLQLINAQLGPLQLAARVVINRIALGASDDETIANIVGDQAAGTGIYGALKAGNRFGVIPRLFAFADSLTGRFTRTAPGTTVTRAAKFGGNTGTGLMTLGAPAFTGGVKAGVYRVRAKTAAANGGVFSVVDPDGQVLADATVGNAYASVVKFTIADGATDFAVGDGFDVTVTIDTGAARANPICAALPAVLNALLAHAIVDGPGTTKQDAIDWRETLSSPRLIALDAFVTAVGMADDTFTGASPIAAGLAVAVDQQTKGRQGVPSQSFAYQAVQGITALKRYDSFSLSDGANDGQELLTNNIGIIQRGEIGVETAAASSGFVLIAFDNAGTDETFRFYNVTRTRDYAHLQVLKRWRERLGKNNITRHGVQAVLNDAIVFFGGMKTNEHIIDFRLGVDGKAITIEDIRAGDLPVFLKFEEASPLVRITAESFRYRDALGSLITDIATDTNQILAA